MERWDGTGHQPLRCCRGGEAQPSEPVRKTLRLCRGEDGTAYRTLKDWGCVNGTKEVVQ